MDAAGATRFGEVRRFREVDSTNRVAADLARAGAPHGVVVVADHQTAGRGRHGRRWEAPPGSSLLASVLLRPHVDLMELQLVTTAAGTAAAEACADVAGVAVGLKWPNDLLVGDEKLGGILAELIAGAVVVGLGLNVNWHTPLPAGATALNHLTGGDVDREALLAAFLARLELHAGDLAGHTGRGRLLRRYRELCATLGRTVRVRVADDTFVGRAIDITDSGHLIVCGDDADGPTHAVSAGSVTHLE